MNVQEFVSKILKDKDFLYQVAMNVPEEYLRKPEEEETKSENEESDPNIMAEMLLPGAKVLGVEATDEEFNDEFSRQLKALGAFSKIRFMMRFFKTLGKAAKDRGLQS